MEQVYSCDTVASKATGLDRRSLLEELAGKGVRITAQRRVLVETIQQATNHLDAAGLLNLARRQDPHIDRATVYRTIDLLKKLGLIDELDLMHLQGEKHYYEVKTRREHIHLACFRCGAIEEFASPLLEELKNEIAQTVGFQSRVTRLELGGTCRACRGTANRIQNAVEDGVENDRKNDGERDQAAAGRAH